MPNPELLQHPVLEVSLNGQAPEARPSRFRLYTQAGFHSVLARLFYPADTEAGAVGDEVTVSLASADSSDLYFTGTVYSANTHGDYRELLLTDSYKKLCDTAFAAAYRKEQAGTILDDILGAAGINEKAVTCPAVELARFSTQSVPARTALDLLIDALKEHGEEGLCYFFDETDRFHFGTLEDTGKNEGAEISFETGKNILRKGSGWIEVLPAPVRHSRDITVDSRALVTVRSDLSVARSLSRLTLWVREAAA